MAEQILLVDDEPNVLHALQRQLRGRYTVHTATSGEAALRLCREAGPFAVIVSERTRQGKATTEHRYYLSSLPTDAARLNRTVRQHWRVENNLHWCMDVAFDDDQMRARTDNAAHNFAVLRHFVLNLIRLAPVKRKGGIKVQRLIASTSDSFRAQLLRLV